MDEGGQTTRCPAVEHDPCLLITAKTFEIYPKEKMVARDVKVYAKGKHIYSRDLWVNRLDGESENRIMPRIGYDGSDNGMYAKLQVDYNLGPKQIFMPIWLIILRPVINPCTASITMSVTLI